MKMIRLTDLADNMILVDYESIERVWRHIDEEQTIIQPKGKQLLRESFKVKEPPEEVYSKIEELIKNNKKERLNDKMYEAWAKELMQSDPGNQGA